MATLKSPTLGKLITNIRNLLGQTNPVNSSWTDLELTEYINEAIRMYMAEVIKNSEGYFMTAPYFFECVTNQEEYALPADFFEAKALYIQRTNGWDILEYNNDLTHGFLTASGTGAGGTYSPLYYFRGNSIVLHPTPNFNSVYAQTAGAQPTVTGSFRLDYFGFPDQLVSGGDSMTNQVSPVFKQLIEMYAVKKAKMKQSMVSGTDLTTIANQNFTEILALFRDTINKRSQYPEFVVPFNPEG